jgi:hypothetical protein
MSDDILTSIIAILLVLGLMAGLGAVDYYIGYHNETNVTDTITKTERVTKDDDSYYLVYGQNETYKITDMWLKKRFDSSDVYGRIAVGHTYNLHVIGMRIPILSEYRNILDAKEL